MTGAPTRRIRTRRRPVRLLLALGGVLAALALVAGHLNQHLLDGPTFAAHFDDIRRDEAVAEQAGRAITDQILRSNPDLVALRPLVDSVAIQVAGGDALSGPTRRAAAAAHEVLTEPGADSLVLRIADVGAIVSAAIAAVAPERVPEAGDVSITLVSIGSQSFASSTLALARVIGVLAWLLPLAAVACLAGAILLERDRWRGAMRVGWALVGAAVGVGVVLVAGQFLVRRLDTSTLGGAVARAAWREFVRPLWWSALIMAALGVVVVVAFGSELPATARARASVWRARLTTPPTTAAGVAARAVASGVVGVAAIADPLGTVELAAFVAGAALVLFAVAELAALIPRPRTAAATAGGEQTRGRPARPALLTGAAVVVLLVAGVVVLARPTDDVEASPSTGTVCNGHAELCDRTFDEVAYAASHNAMAAATEPGWFLAEQSDSIVVQLDQGVRALLVDVWSGRPAGTVVRTAPSSYAEALAVTEAELGPDIVAAAQRVADSVAGVAEGPEARYLCHGLCETGSTPFLAMLGDLRAWLATHPDDVVTLFIEDHVDAALIADDITTAGLLPYVFQPPAENPWPTLGEMIAADQRLVVMVEEGDGGAAAPWLVNGFQYTQDTPYTFPTVESFSCAANRGPADAPLLLLNHWLSGFSSLVTNAQQVNARDVLLPRATQCQDERGQIPNFVGVNYVAMGDVFTVVDELNGVAG